MNLSPPNWVDLIGYAGVILTLVTFYMTTMIPLRILGIIANFIFILFGYFAAVYPALVLHLLLLPLNSFRLWQMVQLIKKVREASDGDLSIDWLKPYMSPRKYKAGDIVFKKADVADRLYYTVTGLFRLKEIAADIEPGQLIGEVAIVTPENKRTLTLECAQDGEVLTVSYNQVRQLYFQNPEFGFYLLRLVGQRLSRDISRLEAMHTPNIRP